MTMPAPGRPWIVSLGGLYLERTRTQIEYGLGTRNVIWVRDRGHRSQTVEHLRGVTDRACGCGYDITLL